MSSQATGNAEVLVNNGYIAAPQTASVVRTLANGDWIVTWGSNGLFSEGAYGIFQQRYTIDGFAIGKAELVSSESGGASEVIAMANGGWMTAWKGVGEVYNYQMFSASGEKIGAATSLLPGDVGLGNGIATSLAVTGLANGGFEVAWAELHEGFVDVFQRRFLADGTSVDPEPMGGAFDQENSNSSFVDIASSPDGGWVTTWTAQKQGLDSDVYFCKFDAFGNSTVATTRVNAITALNQDNSAVAMLEDGGFVVTYLSETLVNGQLNSVVLEQRFDADGTKNGAEHTVNVPAAGGKGGLDVTGLIDGGWVTLWTLGVGGDTNVYQQRFDVRGNKVGDETLVNVYTANDQTDPSIAASADGGWVVSWTSSGQASATSAQDIYQRRFARDIEGTNSSDKLAGTNFDEYIIGFNGNDILGGKAGNDIMVGGGGNDTYYVNSLGDQAQELAGRGADTVIASVDYSIASYLEIENITLSGSARKATGNGSVNRLIGNAYGNTLLGGGGNDFLNGSGGADVMQGGIGNDIYVVNAWNDKVSEAGGGGIDLVQSSATKFTMATGIENLTLIGAGRNATGNSIANHIVGNGRANVLIGGKGGDTLNGGGGKDKLDGGAGNDKLYGGTGNDIYVVNSGKDFISDSSGNDTVNSTISLTIKSRLENLILIGSAHNGTGNAGSNEITGNKYANSLSGMAGNDDLHGEGGRDKLSGGRGNDILDGGSGNDDLTGGQGADHFVFARAFGHDIVRDFGIGADKVDLRAVSEVANFADFKEHYLSFHGRDAIISIGANTVVLRNVSEDEVSARDFLF